MWIFDNCEILEDDDFKLLHDGELHSLVIREVYPEDAGIYYCKAFNAAGEEQCSAKIDVKGKNERPCWARFNDSSVWGYLMDWNRTV